MALYVMSERTEFNKEGNSDESVIPGKVLRKIHRDEDGAVSLETVLIIGAIAMPILIFLIKVAWPESGASSIKGCRTWRVVPRRRRGGIEAIGRRLMIGAVLLLALLAVATATDLARHKIYNWNTYPGTLAAWILNAAGMLWLRVAGSEGEPRLRN